jgi:hypothetical protein
MTEQEFQQKVLDLLNQHTEALAGLDARLTALETAWRGRETNPLPKNFAERFDKLEENVEGLGFEITLLRERFDDEALRRVALAKRVSALEETK